MKSAPLPDPVKKRFKINGVEATYTFENPYGMQDNGEIHIPSIGLERDKIETGGGVLSIVRNWVKDMDDQPQRYRDLLAKEEANIATLKNNLAATYDSSKLEELESRVAKLETAVLLESQAKEKADKKEASREKEMQEKNPTGDPAIEKQIRQAWDDLDKAQGGQLNSGLPFNLLPHYTKLAYLYAKKGLQTVSQFAKAMGVQIDKIVTQAWNAGKAYWREQQKLGIVPAGVRKMMAPGFPGGGGGGGGSAPTPGGAPSPSSRLSSLGRVANLRNQAKLNAEQMVKDMEKMVFGNITLTDNDTFVKPSLLNKALNTLNNVQDNTAGRATKAVNSKIRQAAEAGMESKNKILRNIAKMTQSVFSGLGKSEADVMASEKMAGEAKSRAVADSVKISKMLRSLIESDPKSYARIQRVIDPSFYQELSEDQFVDGLRETMNDDEVFDKIGPVELAERYAAYREVMKFDDPEFNALTVADLTPEEKKVHDIIRFMYDTMHEINFSIGKLTADTYEDNKGNYSARLYDTFEIPDEAKKVFKSSPLKIDNSLYMERGPANEWKFLNRMEDPIYAVAKRLQQTMANKAIYDYAEYVSTKKPGATASEDTKGYRKLGMGFGPLSNKWVRDDIAEDFVGYYYANEQIEKFHDFVKHYDKIPARQFYKKLFTVYNPATHMGNIMGNFMFGALVGINPVRMVANLNWAMKQAKEYTPEYRYLLSQGVLQSDLTRDDLVKSITDLEEQIDTASKSKNPFKYVSEKMKAFYAGTDDVFKTAAFKALIDLGYKPAEAANKVKEGFQNYRRVGKSYDLMSKVPLIGNPFGKFAGDLMRITKDSITKRPLTTMTFLATLKIAAQIASMLSDEDDDERRIREARSGAPKIPLPDFLGGDISLGWKVGGTEWNMARFLSPLFLYGSSDGDDDFELVSKLLPQHIETVDWTQNPGGKTAVVMAKNLNDPLWSGVLQLALNSDFLGRPIIDPKANKYVPDTGLLMSEKVKNAARFLARAYVPYYNQGEDIAASLQGEEDYYGRTRLPWQTISSFLGVSPKITEFPDSKYGAILETKMNSFGYKFQDQGRIISRLKKDLKEGTITQEKYNERVGPVLIRQAEIAEQAREEYERLKGPAGRGVNLNLKKRGDVMGTDPKEESEAKPKENPSGINISLPNISKPTLPTLPTF
jgi:hypothetical protein